MNRNVIGVVSCALCLVCSARPVLAQRAGGVALDRFDPSERGSEWFVLDSLDIQGHLRPAVGVVGDWGYKPLVIYADDGSEQAALVRHQVFVHVGASLVLWDRLRFGLNAPVAVYQAGSPGSVGGVSYTPAEKASFGDARLGADVRLVGRPHHAFSLAVGAQVHLPTGDRSQFTSDGTVRLGVPRVQVAGEVGSFAYAGRLGFGYRAQNDSFGGGQQGSEILFGGAAGVRFANRRVMAGPEIFGSTVAGDGAFGRTGTPFEVLFGMHYTDPTGLRVGGGFGPGLTRGLGAPQLRFVLSVEWAPAQAEPREPAPSDRDQDGVLDPDDACPDVAGVPTKDPKTSGCPLLDRDKDGVPDGDDACPDAAGIRSDDPMKDGCPAPADRDGDGILDADDACPDVAGVQTRDAKTNGCPRKTDRDNDGVLDAEDACPDQAGPRSTDPKTNGCPAVRVESGQIKITEQIKFNTNSAEILKESDEILTGIAKILKDRPSITWMRVEGHTDNRGNAKLNKTLSAKRAASVVKWLNEHGIELERMMSQGFGSDRPIDLNDTEEGRKNNRRVEFHIDETGK